jgi:hypothetical protein
MPAKGVGLPPQIEELAGVDELPALVFGEFPEHGSVF